MALALRCTVSELQERLNSYEFSEWQAFFSIEPFGSYTEDLRAALICQKLAGGRVSDYVLHTESETKTESNGYHLLQTARMITEVFKAMKAQKGNG